jgi:hypothetical protein
MLFSECMMWDFLAGRWVRADQRKQLVTGRWRLDIERLRHLFQNYAAIIGTKNRNLITQKVL